MSVRTLSWPQRTRSSLLRPNPPSRNLSFSQSTSQNHGRLGCRAKEKLLDREFFLSLLSSASSKRETKRYLARLKNSSRAGNERIPALKKKDPSRFVPEPSRTGVEFGVSYDASQSIYNSPVFRLDSTPSPPVEESHETLHLTVVKIMTPQFLDDYTVDGVAKTLSQLSRLGSACCVVVDPGVMHDANESRSVSREQVERISMAVETQPGSKSLCLDSILSIASTESAIPKVLSRKSLVGALRDGKIIIMTSVAYTEDSSKAVSVPADNAVIALTKEFAGLATTPYPDEEPLISAQRIDGVQKEVSLDRVIILDPLGGIPAFSGPHESHVFINMEQEFADIQDELLKVTQDQALLEKTGVRSPPSSQGGSRQEVSFATSPRSMLDGHLANLELSRHTLALLPATSSGIITSPLEVAVSAKGSQHSLEPSAVGTRRQQNPLIHSLLTDKSLHSPSLPRIQRAVVNSSSHGKPGTLPFPTTFVKRGMPLTIFPDPRVASWAARDRLGVRLDHPDIDLSRLVYLIEDSFNHKLDVKDYLNRVNNRLAGLIIAGDYEGGAILTWETPPGVVDDGSEENAARLVPYLDKFAVLKRSQGAGGVADIVFNGMVRGCFPNGVCWRSRKDNPVNKWYFERSQGTWKLPNSNWTMFWTTPRLLENAQMFSDYEAVCCSIQPSWADHGILE